MQKAVGLARLTLGVVASLAVSWVSAQQAAAPEILPAPAFTATQLTDELAAARNPAGHPVERLHVPGHSHLSEAYAMGTADESVSGPVLNFIRANIGHPRE
jgi:hypothetical protein